VSRLAIVGALGAVVLGATAAFAKTPPETTVCGRSLSLPERTCLKLGWENPLAQQLSEGRGEAFSLRPKPRPGPYYTVRFHFPDDARWDWWFVYVPSRHVIRESTPNGVTKPMGRSVYWRTVPATVSAAFETLSKRVRPFPAPRRWR